MYTLAKAECNYFEEWCNKSQFQRVHARQCRSKLKCCLYRLWEWRSHYEDD